MAPSNNERQVRDRLLLALKKELMGPGAPDEVINEYPTSRYVVGRLAPARIDENDKDGLIEQTENEKLAMGVSSEEDGEEEPQPPLIIGFNPSSFGLSFLIDSQNKTLQVRVAWGNYKREKDGLGKYVWKRYPISGVVDGVQVAKAGAISKITLSPSASNPPGVSISQIDDMEISIEGVVHDLGGHRAVSLFLINRRTKGQLGDRSKDERWIYQPSVYVTTSNNSPVFVAKDYRPEPTYVSEDDESSTNELLYRDSREFATGHGVSAGWAEPVDGGKRTTAVFTEFIPSFETPMLIAPADKTGGATLDMKFLAEMSSASELIKLLKPMVDEYESWIDKIENESEKPEIKENKLFYEVSKINIKLCRVCASRIKDGLLLIQSDEHVFEAFKFSNRAMWDQRIHSLWAATNRKAGVVKGTPYEYDFPKNRTWRPFQLGFILLNLCGVADENSSDREIVDLLWFPTGGGKTEAYLGLSAFVIALRRLRGNRYGMEAGAGVSVIMRYTLRLLTVQQFQRAAALIAACEVIRYKNPKIFGQEPFRIGIWVGKKTTPNTFSDSAAVIEKAREGRRPSTGSPIQLVSCPRCGSILVSDKGVPEPNTYVPDKATQRTLIWCNNKECEFSSAKSNQAGLPVVVVDEEIYRTRPSIIVATVDKFARMPFKGETHSLFGFRNRYSQIYGHLTEAHGDYVESKKICKRRSNSVTV